jgi:hypothetical protein
MTTPPPQLTGEAMTPFLPIQMGRCRVIRGGGVIHRLSVLIGVWPPSAQPLDSAHFPQNRNRRKPSKPFRNRPLNSSGPRASRSLGFMSERDARGPHKPDHDAIISASRRTPNYGRYIEDIVGRLETDVSHGASFGMSERSAPDKSRGLSRSVDGPELLRCQLSDSHGPLSITRPIQELRASSQLVDVQTLIFPNLRLFQE